MNFRPAIHETLPLDAERAALVGRAWLPGSPGGPAVVAVRGDELIDLSSFAPTASALFELPDAARLVRQAKAPVIGSVAAALEHAQYTEDRGEPRLLAPCDLQPVKAAGVTFAASLLERVIEEQARGDPAKAQKVRRQIAGVAGDDLSKVRPGTPQAAKLKDVLIAQGAWSQYLEVGIGPDAEVFTKAAPMSTVGTGVDIGLHPGSSWNNPEPEIVLVIDSRGEIRGAALGNDVNLRDFEGRSALLLGKAKDNNGSCAIGPFVRLFDASYGIDDVRRAVVRLEVRGDDGFLLEGSSSMALISRDPVDLAAQTIGATHQYPDGVMLFCGTMFAPVQDRDAPGGGFTHKVGDLVWIGNDRLGALINRIGHSDQIPPWRFGIGALMANLAQRGLLAREAGHPSAETPAAR
jgi:fumarylacetoacetate (FAA) hydrolase family protein